MIPLIVWGIGLAIVALVGGTIYTVQINNIRGKRFAILGARASGKTTLHKFLSEGKISAEYVKSTEDKVKDNHFKLKHLSLRIKSATDIGGSEDFISRWENIISQADYICYIIKADKIEENDKEYIIKVKAHIDLILNRMKDHKIENKNLHLIYSFCDLIPQYLEDNDKFIESFIKRNLEINRKGTVSFYGSLNNSTNAEELCVKLLSKISE